MFIFLNIFLNIPNQFLKMNIMCNIIIIVFNVYYIMSEKKTIKINENFFKISNGVSKSSKTKKNNVVKNTPIISTKKIKTKFLNKLKEHKDKEYQQKNKDLKIKKFLKNTTTNYLPKQDKNENNNNDDFKDSLEYLTSLSKNYELKNSLHKTKTLKNNQNIKLNIDLPAELENINLNKIKLNEKNNQNPLKLNYKVDNIVPFGCLKNGIKPCYRNWKTSKNYGLNDLMTKEEKIKNINKKLKNIENNMKRNIPQQSQQPQQSFQSQPLKEQEEIVTNNSSINFTPVIVKMNDNENKKDHDKVLNEEKIEISNKTDETSFGGNVLKDFDVPVKQTIKKTIKKKYTLGKNKIKQRVSILIKDNKTRKNIMKSHKLLKSKPIGEIKRYLREHNLIKTGSFCPIDVLRKMYESAVLSGEIINTDKSTLIHNIMNEKEE